MVQLVNKNKILIFAFFLNVCIFLLLGAVYFGILSFQVEALRLLTLSRPLNIIFQITQYINFPIITFGILVLQIVLNTKINMRLKLSGKQVIIVNALLFFTFLTLIAIQIIPALIKRNYCSELIQRYHGNEVGECMTFMENSKAGVVYIFGVIFLGMCLTSATGLQLLLLTTKDKMKILSFGILSLAISGMIIFLPSVYVKRTPKIEVKPYPQQKLPPVQLDINNNQKIDQKTYQLQSDSSVRSDKVNTNEWKTYVARNYNLSFEYPSSWTVGSCDGETIHLLHQGNLNCGSEQGSDILISPINTTEQIFLSYQKDNFEISSKIISVESNKYDQVTGHIKSDVQPAPGYVDLKIWTFIPSQNNIYLVGYDQFDKNGPSYQEIYQRVISTFKFQ